MPTAPVPSSAPNPRQSHLLAVLPEPESKRLLPHMELVSLPLGKALYESGDELNHVYFPTTAIVSLLYELENGSSAEIAVVGKEGIVGIALFMGGDDNAESGCGAEFRPRISAAGTAAQGGVQPRRGVTAPAAALYPCHADPDGTDGRLQSSSFRGSAALSLAPAQSGPPSRHGACHDPGTDRQHAGRAARGSDRGCREVAEGRFDSLSSGSHHRDRSTWS